MDNDLLFPNLPAMNADERKKKRTLGNKIFDLIVYPTIAFGAVFGFSVWATYKGRYGTGWMRDGYDYLARKIERSVFVRNIAPENRFKEAKGHAMVLVSFMAGTLIITPIKWFEDSRDRISQWIDRKLGTTPANPSDYVKEPKQSWKSVLGGRVFTFASVLALDKLVGGHIINGSKWTANKIMSKNVHLDSGADLAAGRGWQVAFVAAFETFYTALCASLVYVISRGLARFFNKKVDERVAAVISRYEPVNSDAAAGMSQNSPVADAENKWSDKAPGQKPRMEKTQSYVRAMDANRSGTMQRV